MINFIDFKRKYKIYKKEINQAAANVFKRGWFILGSEVKKFEEEFAGYLGVKFCVAVNSGTDALFLAIKSLEIGDGDEVITVANTAVPTVAAIRMAGAKPVFVDINEKTFNIDAALIEKAITKKTKAILPVHLYGYPVPMEEIIKIARENNLFVIEDAAQACGAEFDDKKVGTLGDIGCFSFYPTKNLGAFGDGGVIATNNEKLAKKILALRMYGLVEGENKFEGVNSRMDELQAAYLNWSLKKLDIWNRQREKLANLYLENLKSTPLGLPLASDESANGRIKAVWHLFVVKSERRDELKDFLEKKGVQALIHYPMPIFEQPAYQFLGYTAKDLPLTAKAMKMILSLPLYPELKEEGSFKNLWNN